MKLSRYEQEVVINLNADEDEATVYTANPVWIRKMDKLHKEFPDIIRLKSWTEVSKTYILPKKLSDRQRKEEHGECCGHIEGDELK